MTDYFLLWLSFIGMIYVDMISRKYTDWFDTPILFTKHPWIPLSFGFIWLTMGIINIIIWFVILPWYHFLIMLLIVPIITIVIVGVLKAFNIYEMIVLYLSILIYIGALVSICF